MYCQAMQVVVRIFFDLACKHNFLNRKKKQRCQAIHRTPSSSAAGQGLTLAFAPRFNQRRTCKSLVHGFVMVSLGSQLTNQQPGLVQLLM